MASPGEGMSDRELLVYVAGQVEAICDMVTERCDQIEKRIDHADDIAHTVDQHVQAITATLDKYRPLMERYADPGAAVRSALGLPGRKTREKP